MPTNCTFCGSDSPDGAPRCQVCGRPPPDPDFPNVLYASMPEEQEGLRRRYEEALDDADSRSVRDAVNLLEGATAGGYLVTACDLEKIDQLTERPNTPFPIYLRDVESEVRFPGSDRNNQERIPAE